MAEGPGKRFDLDKAIAVRLDGDTEPDADTHLQALAVLVDADLSQEERAEAFGAVMAELLGELNADQRDRFTRIANQEGPVAAMTYVARVTRPVRESDRK